MSREPEIRTVECVKEAWDEKEEVGRRRIMTMTTSGSISLPRKDMPLSKSDSKAKYVT